MTSSYFFWRWLASKIPFESLFSIAKTFSWCCNTDFQVDWSSEQAQSYLFKCEVQVCDGKNIRNATQMCDRWECSSHQKRKEWGWENEKQEPPKPLTETSEENQTNSETGARVADMFLEQTVVLWHTGWEGCSDKDIFEFACLFITFAFS